MSFFNILKELLKSVVSSKYSFSMSKLTLSEMEILNNCPEHEKLQVQKYIWNSYVTHLKCLNHLSFEDFISKTQNINWCNVQDWEKLEPILDIDESRVFLILSLATIKYQQDQQSKMYDDLLTMYEKEYKIKKLNGEDTTEIKEKLRLLKLAMNKN